MVKQVKDQDSQQVNGFNFKSRTAVIAIALVFVMILITIFAVYRSQGGSLSSISMRIDDEIIFQDEYDDFIESADDLNIKEDEARDILISFHKNKIALNKLNVSVDQELIDAQWNLVLGGISPDYLSTEKYEDKLDTPAGQALAFNRYVEILSVDGNGKTYVGSVYHFPYMSATKAKEESLAEDLHKKVESIKGGLSQDVKLIKQQLSKTTQPSASYSGLYLIKPDSSASKVGGAFGLRSGLVPEQVTKSLSEKGTPYVSDLIDVDLSGFYIVRIIDEFDTGDDFKSALDEKTNNVRVVVYDK